MINLEFVLCALWFFIFGFGVREFIQLGRDHKRTMREIEDRYQRLKSTAESGHTEYCGGGGGSFWSGFCATCRQVHEKGECSGKWRN